MSAEYTQLQLTFLALVPWIDGQINRYIDKLIDRQRDKQISVKVKLNQDNSLEQEGDI